MRYSVLLPTRNGGAFLRACIQSVLSQDHDDFELVISDNANTDETPEIIREFASDPRVRAIRLDELVGVTENWNAAYAQSSGDYILMMGDDDYLLPGYFRRIDALIAQYEAPDCILYNGYSFVVPGSIAGDPRAFYSPRQFTFGPDLQHKQILSPETKRGIVRDMFRWKPRIPLNMQNTLVARRAAERIAGGFYQPPFPDHYALNAMLLMDCRWLLVPDQLVIVGISPKSFGHYVYSGKQAGGLGYLGIDPSFPGELPGSALLNGTHVWLDKLRERFPAELAGVEVDRAGYVQRQLFSWLAEKRYGALSWAGLARRFRFLRPSDYLGLALGVVSLENWRRVLPMFSRAKSGASVQVKRLRPLDGCTDIAGFARWIAKRGSVEAD